MSGRVRLSLFLAPLALGACGGDDSASKTAPAKEENRAAGTAQQIIAATSRDVAKVRSYHVEGTETDEEGVGTLEGDVSSDRKLRFTVKVGESALGLIVIDKATYLKANKAFWRKQGEASPALAATLADRWVKAPSSSADILKGLVPKDLAYCLRVDSGSLRKVGPRKQDGRAAVVVADQGDRPGTAPGELYVAATGPALPLRVTQTGRERPGGKLDPRCESDEPGDERSTTTAADYTFSNYDKPVRITAPAGALDLDQLQRDNNSTPA